MRIMFAVPSFWPSQDGVANITGYLAKGLADKGHEIFIFTSAGNSGLQVLPEEEVYENMKIVRMRVETNWPLRLRGRDENSTPRILFTVHTGIPAGCIDSSVFPDMDPGLDNAPS